MPCGTPFDTGELDVPVPERVLVERPRNREHGDYASNVALQLARPAGRPPHAVAELLARRLGSVPGVAKVEDGGPGFLNISLQSAAKGRLVLVITSAGDSYGRSGAFAGQRVNLEFVSANPTGPLHIGGARWAAVGDALARVLQAAGADVASEYYFNDAGAQIDMFAQSLLAAARGTAPPPGGYQGGYLAGIAATVMSCHPDATVLPEADAAAVFGTEGLALMLDEIKGSLARFGVHFDVYRSQKDLHEAGGARGRPGPAARARAHLPGWRGGVAAYHRLRRRQGPGAGQARRQLDLLRRGLRLLPGQGADAGRQAETRSAQCG